MKGKQIISAIILIASAYATYKICKKISEEEKANSEKFEKHKQEVLEEIDGELHQACEMNKDIKDLTLNNTKLNPADRAYAYKLYDEKYGKLLKAKNDKDLDDARKEFEEFIDILINTSDPETVGAYLKIDADAKALEEKRKEDKLIRESELERYRALGDIVEKIGSKVVCELVQ